MAQTLSGSTSLSLRPSPRENFSKPLRRADSLAYKDTRRVYDDIVLGGVFAGKTSWVPSDPTRPSTAGGVMHNTSVFGDNHRVRVYTPKSPAVMFAAEVRTNKPLPSPRSPGKAITTDYVDPNSASWPLQSVSPTIYNLGDRHLDVPTAMEERGKPRLSRWKSLRGLFGRKSPHDQTSSRTNTPFDSHKNQQSLSTTPYRSATTSRATTRSKWEDSNTQPQRPNATSPPASGQTLSTYIPTRGPIAEEGTPLRTDHDRNEGFQGGFRYQRGTTTAATPMIDVEIPDVHLERYSVMFGGLMRSTTEPSLLSRRQSNAKRPTALHPEALRTSRLPYLDTKPCPPTPRSAAKYQLSLFPAPSPQYGQLNPLGMHKPRTLQRSHTSPMPRSPSAFVHRHEPSAMSAFSEEVPVRLEIAPEETVHLPSPHTPGILVTQPTSQKAEAVPTTSTPSSDMSSIQPEPLHDDSPNHGSWPSTVQEPEWEMITDGNMRDRTSNQPTEELAMLTASSDETAAEQPAPQIAIARQMSLTRGRSIKRDLDKERSLTPTLVEKKPMTPLLVQLGHRANQKSHTVQIEGI